MIIPDVTIYVEFQDGVVYERGFTLPANLSLDFADAIAEHGAITVQKIEFTMKGNEV